LQFNYDLKDEKINVVKYFEEEGTFAFNPNSLIQMQIMMQEVFIKLDLKDEYSAKKLEMMLKYELPSFTANRKLVKNWVIDNFVY